LSADTFAAVAYAELSARALAIHAAAAGVFLLLRAARIGRAGLVAAAVWVLLQAAWLAWFRPQSAPLVPAW